MEQADRLHAAAERLGQTPASLHEELLLLDEALNADPGSYGLLWRAARAECQLGEHLSGAEKSDAFERAIERGRRAIATRGDGVEGHYWLGASYGRAAEARRGVGAYFLARKLRGEMETVLSLRPDYEGGDAFLALGELDRGLPGLLGGDRARGRRYLEQGLRIAPDNADLRLALARAYLDERRQGEARPLLEGLASPAASPPVAESIVREARQLLDSLSPADTSRGRAGP